MEVSFAKEIESLRRGAGQTFHGEGILLAIGGEALPLTLAEFAARIADDSRRFGTIIKERKIAAE